jgi:hypothetical protein
MAIWSDAERAALGWQPVVDQRPAFDPAKQTLARGAVAIVAGVPTVQYTIGGATKDMVDAFRDTRLAAGFADAVTGKAWQADTVSVGRLAAVGASALAAIVAQQSPQFTLTAADNTQIVLSATDTLALLNGRMFGWVSATINYARALKNQILAGGTPDITAGWP